MAMLMIRCPQTGAELPTGIETDSRSLKYLPDVLVHTACPHCGFDHSWWPHEAWLAVGSASGQEVLSNAITERPVSDST